MTFWSLQIWKSLQITNQHVFGLFFFHGRMHCLLAIILSILTCLSINMVRLAENGIVCFISLHFSVCRICLSVCRFVTDKYYLWRHIPTQRYDRAIRQVFPNSQARPTITSSCSNLQARQIRGLWLVGAADQWEGRVGDPWLKGPTHATFAATIVRPPNKFSIVIRQTTPYVYYSWFHKNSSLSVHYSNDQDLNIS